MNGTPIRKCPSVTCLLAPIKDKKPFRASKKMLKEFCKSCDPEGYQKHATCRTLGGCPLEEFYNKLWGHRVIPGLTYVVWGKRGHFNGRPLKTVKNATLSEKTSDTRGAERLEKEVEVTK